MYVFFHNPLAAMPGPEFLLVYAAAAVAVIVVSVWQVRAAGGGAPPPVAVQTDRDPYEIAYLRGGANELLRFTVFDLMRQGYLRFSDPSKPGRMPEKIVATERDPSGLAPPARGIVTFYAAPHTTPELFKSELPAQVAAYGTATYDSKLRGEGFFSAPEVLATAARVRLYGFIVLIGLAVYRIGLALLRGRHNIWLLVFETFFAVLILAIATRVPRLSRRGQDFIARLATAVRPVPSGALAAAGGGVLPIVIAATGMEALAGTEYAPMNRLFPQKSSAQSSGCSGGCGSSGGGGDGGGGGGGGCGGGCGG